MFAYKKLLLFLILPLIILFFLFIILTENKTENFKQVVINGEQMMIEEVEDPQLLRLGLAKYDYLPINQGMFFVFSKNDYHGIWMKNMKFPIDIIWLDEDFSVVDIIDNVKPESYPKVFYPKDLARYVLELNAGRAKELEIIIGDNLEIK